MHFEQHELHGNLMKGFLNGDSSGFRALELQIGALRPPNGALEAQKPRIFSFFHLFSNDFQSILIVLLLISIESHRTSRAPPRRSNLASYS